MLASYITGLSTAIIDSYTQKSVCDITRAVLLMVEASSNTYTLNSDIIINVTDDTVEVLGLRVSEPDNYAAPASYNGISHYEATRRVRDGFKRLLTVQGYMVDGTTVHLNKRCAPFDPTTITIPFRLPIEPAEGLSRDNSIRLTVTYDDTPSEGGNPLFAMSARSMRAAESMSNLTASLLGM